MKLRLKETKQETEDVRTFIFEPEQPTSWQPGQYLHYYLKHPDADDRGIERWFTISSPPFEKDITITTRLTIDHGSTFKRALTQLKPGDEIEAEGPGGKFVLQAGEHRPVLIAGGIGITPYHSMLAQLDHDGQEINAELLYANRSQDNIPFHDELEALAAKHQGFHITYFIGDNKIDRAALEVFNQKIKNPIYYVSGPEPMVESLKELLEDIGVAEEDIQLDYFPGYENA